MHRETGMLAPMRIRPATLIAVAVSIGFAGLGGILYFRDRLQPPYGRILGAFIAAWLIFTVLVCVPMAAIAQAARNKRYGVFSHLKQSTSKQVQGGMNVAEKR